MKNVLSAALAFTMGMGLLPGIAAAGSCNNGSLSGAYNVLVVGVEAAATGRAVFSKGKIAASSFTSVDANTGATETSTFTGVYSVSTNCIATGYFTNNIPPNDNFKISLDKMNTAPSTNLAYHGTGVFYENGNAGGTIELTRGEWKF